MHAKNVREVYYIDEIKKILNGLFEEGIALTLAQKKQKELISLPVKIVNMTYHVNSYLEVKSMDLQFLKFDSNKDLVVFCKEKSILFETKFEYTKDKNIKFTLPIEMKGMEKRGEPRLTFEEGEDNEIIFCFRVRGANLRLIEFNRILFDISQGGLSIQIEKNDIPLFKKGKVIDIVKCPAGFENRSAEVLYVKKVKDQSFSKDLYRVGLRFTVF